MIDAQKRSSFGLGRDADEFVPSRRWIRGPLNRAAWSLAGAMVVGALYFGVALEPVGPGVRRNSVPSDANVNKARALMTDADWGLPPNLSDGVVVLYPEIVRELLSRWPGGDGVPIPHEVLAELGINPADPSVIIFYARRFRVEPESWKAYEAVIKEQGPEAAFRGTPIVRFREDGRMAFTLDALTRKSPVPSARSEEERTLCCIRASIERRDPPVGEPENWRALAVADSSRRVPIDPVSVDDMALLANLPKVSPSQYQRWADARELAHPARETERAQEPNRGRSARPPR